MITASIMLLKLLFIPQHYLSLFATYCPKYCLYWKLKLLWSSCDQFCFSCVFGLLFCVCGLRWNSFYLGGFLTRHRPEFRCYPAGDKGESQIGILARRMRKFRSTISFRTYFAANFFVVVCGAERVRNAGVLRWSDWGCPCHYVITKNLPRALFPTQTVQYIFDSCFLYIS